MKEISLEELIPQRAPFLMIDRLEYCDPIFARTSLIVTQDNLFCDNNGELIETAIIENIAQTCAARIGYRNIGSEDSSVKIGYIGAIKGLEITTRPRVGETLETQIEILNEVFAMTLVRAEVKINDKIIATCEMKIALSDIVI